VQMLIKILPEGQWRGSGAREGARYCFSMPSYLQRWNYTDMDSGGYSSMYP